MLYICCLAALGARGDLPELIVAADNTRVVESCRVVIAPELVIADADGNGVVHIAADGITVEFAPGSVLRGAVARTAWDTLTGTGIRLDGRRDVTIRNADIRGYKVGLHATNAHSLTIDGANFIDNFRQRLKSTPRAEDASDWLWPHANDKLEWMNNYGAALVVERSENVDISRVTVRRGQNGIILDRVEWSRVYDCDCSFLSGWGLALWRSSWNTVSRNAFDFCVRGHSEGVYNRGQDSAGILAFEQCSRNAFIENSVTHGGDGFFGFAGKEALGEVPGPEGFDYATAGCNENLFLRNDFSYAVAHGLELTFSKGNTIAHNRFVENAICGIWGGYSRSTTIYSNTFERNGGLAYGLEAGGVNIEHGSANRILDNRFIDNRAAVHLWWDNDSGLLEMPGVKEGYRGVADNLIANNLFVFTATKPFGADAKPLVAFRLREQPAQAESKLHDNVYFGNKFLNETVATEFDVTPGREPLKQATPTTPGDIVAPQKTRELGVTKPVLADAVVRGRFASAREHLRGRQNIIMDEWGPWDHETPFMRPVTMAGGEHTYEVFGAPARFMASPPKPVVATLTAASDPSRTILAVTSETPGVHPYELSVRFGNQFRAVGGVLVKADWTVKAFTWDEACDPRTHLDSWRARAADASAATARVPALNFPFAGRGPREQPWGAAAAAPARDRFGIIAVTKLNLPAGRWTFSTLSDDGVRVLVNGHPVIENWTWHGPTRDTGTFVQPAGGDADITVEYFEIDGHAVLTLDIVPAP